MVELDVKDSEGEALYTSTDRQRYLECHCHSIFQGGQQVISHICRHMDTKK